MKSSAATMKLLSSRRLANEFRAPKGCAARQATAAVNIATIAVIVIVQALATACAVDAQFDSSSQTATSASIDNSAASQQQQQLTVDRNLDTNDYKQRRLQMPSSALSNINSAAALLEHSLQDIVSRARSDRQLEQLLLNAVLNKHRQMTNTASQQLRLVRRSQLAKQLEQRVADERDAASLVVNDMISNELGARARDSQQALFEPLTSGDNIDTGSGELASVELTPQRPRLRYLLSNYLRGFNYGGKRTYNPCSFNAITCFAGRRFA